jgi:diguanylate cyclase (GGDEF)-like protein
LVDIAKILASQSPHADTAGRWGGEEFMIVIPNSTLERAAAFAEKLRAHVANATFPYVGQMTVSVGVSSYEPGDDLDLLVNRADEALYRAKNNGRNCVGYARGFAARG